ncbi:hypothetical protein [Streptomyces rapamycinicus]|uniref:Hydrolase n=2 Tax=Streptomyces rapamycinicus TaxID=1226757 RepID=A0A3L8RPE3_STRRN|nr:hypothetical protein [Streptomyces rapamycinicus]MBB4782815.1 hypothetical protein [Streptomyces rapamycinicus]RLV81705.1 hydrolase [Streptomyces rapamycinicus NRRL 5491]
MAARCHTSADAFTTAYWTHRPPYDAGRHAASAYWTDVLHALSRPADADTIEELRLTDIDSWSRVDDRMVTYVRTLRDRARVVLLSNIPADSRTSALRKRDYLDRAVVGGFAETVKRTPRRRTAFFNACLSTIVERDVLEPASIERHGEILKLLGLLAGRAGGLAGPCGARHRLGYSPHHAGALRRVRTPPGSLNPTARPVPCWRTSSSWNSPAS